MPIIDGNLKSLPGFVAKATGKVIVRASVTLRFQLDISGYGTEPFTYRKNDGTLIDQPSFIENGFIHT